MKFISFCFVLLYFACGSPKAPVVTDPFFGMQPTEEPQLLAPELLASPAGEFNGTFSPDGKAFYYSLDIPESAVIVFTELQADNTWSAPRIAAFSGQFTDYDPLFSPDGERLYFSSRRPETDKMSRVWYVDKLDNGWSEPKLVKLIDGENDEYYSSLTHSGEIYFNLWSNGKLYRAQPADSAYVVEELPEMDSVHYSKGDPFVSPDGDYLIFRGYREDRLGQGDLYISFNNDGAWTRPQNLGSPINSPAHEICPYVTANGQFLIFASNRQLKTIDAAPLQTIEDITQLYRTHDNGVQNIYYVSTTFIDRLRAKQ